MAFEMRDGQCFIFENKEQGGNRPQRKGKLKIAGVEYEISCWEKEGRNGSYLSCNISDIFKPEVPKTKYNKEENSKEIIEVADDDIPF